MNRMDPVRTRDAIQDLPVHQEPGLHRETHLQTGFVTQRLPEWITARFDGDGNGVERVGADYAGHARYEPGGSAGDAVTVGLSDGSEQIGVRPSTSTDVFELSTSLQADLDGATLQTGFVAGPDDYLVATISTALDEAVLETPDDSVPIPTPQSYALDSRSHVPVSVVWDRTETRGYVVANGSKSPDVDAGGVSWDAAYEPRFLELTREGTGDAAATLRAAAFCVYQFW